jgi:Crinkler effector protein N-terminal domain
MRGDAARLLICIVEGESAVLQIKVPIDSSVLDIKKLVLEESRNGALRDVDSKDLVLWKVCRN